ncbi:thioredoxin-dependent thiol peroxidase [Pontibacter oryzae]|uniref:thioredoxin-dependent peroxiredoxin n=1 Tax=Pontibacter oryzae TaxID=2304593 RepID=A0A399SGI9_9BACT|nr:thioredoxin-dependent thiol peroxidase [Pontibacter oryzae]RIJ42700.1 thioredoxin-dependent thiol peroxidase [Pontibacter oryzae]
MQLNIGDNAPDFEGKDQNGNTVKLSDYRGKKVILYFYPKDNTSGCTAQACNLRDNHADLQQQGYQVIGVSTDSEKSHQNFIAKHELPFTLIADTEKEIVQQYGVWQEKSMYGRKYMGTMRYTFVIDEEGIIQDIITKVKTKEHSAQILK